MKLEKLGPLQRFLSRAGLKNSKDPILKHRRMAKGKKPDNKKVGLYLSNHQRVILGRAKRLELSKRAYEEKFR